jgi:hypothetical protein
MAILRSTVCLGLAALLVTAGCSPAHKGAPSADRAATSRLTWAGVATNGATSIQTVAVRIHGRHLVRIGVDGRDHWHNGVSRSDLGADDQGEFGPNNVRPQDWIDACEDGRWIPNKLKLKADAPRTAHEMRAFLSNGQMTREVASSIRAA